MGRTEQYHGIVLRTHDVGEADRFCILLTEERGKIAARAHGVRKLKSRMGGSLLILQETNITVHEGRAGLTIRSAGCERGCAKMPSLTHFLQAEQAVELLLSLLEDDHPVPDIFAVTREFLQDCRKGGHATALAFTIRLLGLLGVLPREAKHRMFDHCTMEERGFVDSCFKTEWWKTPAPATSSCLRSLCNRIIAEQTGREMRAVSSSFQTNCGGGPVPAAALPSREPGED